MSLELLAQLAVRYYFGVQVPCVIGTTDTTLGLTLLDRYRVFHVMTVQEFNEFLRLVCIVADVVETQRFS